MRIDGSWMTRALAGMGLLALVVTVAPQAIAQSTQTLGAVQNYDFSEQGIACRPGSDYVMVGIEATYSSQHIGKIRAFCRRIDQNGALSENAVPSAWSRTNAGDYSQSKTSMCTGGQVMVAFRGSYRQHSTRTGISQLAIGCRNIDQGETTGSISWKTAIGPGGGTSISSYPCSNPRPAMWFNYSSKTYLQSLSIGCGLPEVTPTIPGTFALRYPSNNAGFIYGRDFEWDRADNATTYYLLIGPSNVTNWGDNGSLDPRVLRLHIGNRTQAAFNLDANASLKGTAAKWRVEAHNNGYGRLSEIRSINFPLSRVQQQSPAHRATVSTTRPTFSWNSVPGAAFYKLVYRGAAGDAVDTSGTSWTPPSPLPPGDYEWTVVSCAYIGGSSTATCSFSSVNEWRDLTISSSRR